jgi:hypothetical protein
MIDDYCFENNEIKNQVNIGSFPAIYTLTRELYASYI